ncbi:reverse transcriptase [Phytophthora cinnamomi]|uniref:reverse transcriptase n=1 Tax=Phytophthora cinnamomi TaxID=4785 RepID=UPI00355960B1|nr:reverse transcriptase [Phytophthora cinnamomi]
MLWEWLVMPQGLKNAPAIFNRCVTHLLRSVRDFTPSYFDDVFIYSRAVDWKTVVEMHRVHLRKLLELMRKHKLYANLKKCIFGASEIPVLGCLVGKNGVRPDPEKVRVINEWPTPSSVKELRQFLGLATYLCKYVEDYAGKIRPLSQLLKKEAVWNWTPDCQKAFDAVKRGLTEAPILAVADQDRPFHVVCDASDFAIGCALMQHDHEGRDRVVYYQSRQLKPAEQTADVHAIDIMRSSNPTSSLLDDVKAAFAHDADAKLLLAYGTAPSDKSRQKLPKHLRARAHRFRVHDGLLLYNAVDDNAIRVVVPNDHDLRLRIMYEYHDAPTAGHLGREKTYVLLTRDFYWHHQYNGGNTGVVVFVDRFSKMVHLAAVPAEVTAKQTARLFVDMVFKQHGMPTDIVSDRDPRFTANLWQEVITLLGSQLSMSTADHPQTDGQTERVNRVLVDMLKSYAHSFQYWSECLSMAEFAINNSVHASTWHTPFYVNAMRHPRLPSLLGVMAPTLSGGGSTTATKQSQKAADTCTVSAATTMNKTTRSARSADLGRKNQGSAQGADPQNKENESVQSTDSTWNKDHGSAQGADTVKNHAEAGPLAESELNDFISDAINFLTKR